jgi:hypothetical protein
MRTWVTPGTTVEVLLQNTRKAPTRVSLQTALVLIGRLNALVNNPYVRHANA